MEIENSNKQSDHKSLPESHTSIDMADTDEGSQVIAVRGKPTTKVNQLGDPKTPSLRTVSLSLFHAAGKAVIVFAVLVSFIFCLGVAQRKGWLRDSQGIAGDQKDAGKTSRYICPMMCTPPTSKPGRCPVCAMELVVAAGAASNDGISITIDPHARRVAGITTAVAKSEELKRTIRSVGTIEFDESRLSTISAHVDGRIEELYANYLGVEVSKGDNLALVYSPQLYTAQAEYVAGLQETILDSVIDQRQGMSAIAKEKLIEFGMTDSQIDDLQVSREPKSRVQLKSPQDGTVLEKNAVEGDYVKAGDSLFRVADLKTVWLVLDLFPDDAALVRFGQIVQAEVQSVQGEVFTGRIAFIAPTVNPATKTVRVRVEILNLEGELRPGDFASARIMVPALPLDQVYDPDLAGKFISPMHPQLIRDTAGPCPLCGMDLIPTSDLGFSDQPVPGQMVVTVPRESLLLAGNHAVTYVETDPGRFEIRQVTVGVMTDERAVIVEGLAEGETVALNGNFLIDSQMQLIGNPSLIDPTRAPTFSAEPLALPRKLPQVFAGNLGRQIDQAFQLYFEMQETLAADLVPNAITQNSLINSLVELDKSEVVPNLAKRHIASARHGVSQLRGTIEDWRSDFRRVSHAMLRVATEVRGEQTASSLIHYHCTMVPGNGGDWMQSQGEKQNPYWGSKMLRCGNLVSDLSVVALEKAFGKSGANP